MTEVQELIKDYLSLIIDSITSNDVCMHFDLLEQYHGADAQDFSKPKPAKPLDSDTHYISNFQSGRGLIDNSGYERDMTHPLNRKLVASRGKNFTKEKQKNKNKLYSLSMESNEKSFKFSDSD